MTSKGSRIEPRCGVGYIGSPNLNPEVVHSQHEVFVVEEGQSGAMSNGAKESNLGGRGTLQYSFTPITFHPCSLESLHITQLPHHPNIDADNKTVHSKLDARMHACKHSRQ